MLHQADLAMDRDQQDAVLYHEPSILTILIQSSFLLNLVFLDFALDSLVCCGLIGQILIGLAYGTPGGNVLGTTFQQTITDLGYLGLILLVYEGGLSTDIKALMSNALLSVLVALTGISLPIGFSFVLIVMSNASVLQSFAAGCALSSTSLGTTFTILKASGIGKSRLGVVLTSAAMLDDVVGLVLVQVISNLGSSARNFTAITVLRPVFVSLAYALVIPLALYAWKRLTPRTSTKMSTNRFILQLQSARGQLLVQTLVLIASVASAAYAGTSTLLAAYLAGLLIVSFESLALDRIEQQKSRVAEKEAVSKGKDLRPSPASDTLGDTGSWELVGNTNPDEIAPITSTIATRERSTHTAEDGTSKKIDGQGNHEKVSLMNQDAHFMSNQATNVNDENSTTMKAAQVFETYYAQPLNKILRPFFFASIGFSIPITRLFTAQILWRGIVYAIFMVLGKVGCGFWLIRFTSTRSRSTNLEKSDKHRIYEVLSRLASYRPQSLYPACMLGSAMVARGEIGFLISAIAQSNSIFDQAEEDDEIFLIVTWAILLCTIVGPLTIGLMARRIKRLEKMSEETTAVDGTGTKHPLGIWKDI